MGKIETDGGSMMSRRDFLKFSGLALGGLAFGPWMKRAEIFLGADPIGRVVELPDELRGEALYSLHGEGVDVGQASFFGVEYGGVRTDFALVAPYIDTQTGAVYPVERLFVSEGFNRQWSRYGKGNRNGKFMGEANHFDWRGLDSGIVQGEDRLPASQMMVWSLNEQPVLWYPLAREGWEKQAETLGSSGMFFLPPEKIAKRMGYDVAKGPVFLPVDQMGETGGGKKLLALAMPETVTLSEPLTNEELLARVPSKEEMREFLRSAEIVRATDRNGNEVPLGIESIEKYELWGAWLSQVNAIIWGPLVEVDLYIDEEWGTLKSAILAPVVVTSGKDNLNDPHFLYLVMGEKDVFPIGVSPHAFRIIDGSGGEHRSYYANAENLRSLFVRGVQTRVRINLDFYDAEAENQLKGLTYPWIESLVFYREIFSRASRSKLTEIRGGRQIDGLPLIGMANPFDFIEQKFPEKGRVGDIK